MKVCVSSNSVCRPRTVQIRRGNTEDEEAILSCLAAAFEPYHSQYTPQAFADTVLDSETVQRRMREMDVFVAVSEGQVIGTISYGVRGDKGHMRGMAVLPGWLGAGVGSALLTAVEKELLVHGCTCATLDTTQPLRRAIRFYERHGFSASGRITDFFGMKLYEYVKRLSQLPEGNVQ
jgi:GNAT superfamily N-acetyltransferase